MCSYFPFFFPGAFFQSMLFANPQDALAPATVREIFGGEERCPVPFSVGTRPVSVGAASPS